MWRSPAIPWLVGAGLGALVGVVVVHPMLGLMAAVAVGGGGLVVALVRWPQLAPTLFWIAFSLQSTIFFGFSITGLYYPIYLFMVANVVVALAVGRLEIHRRLIPYGVFLLFVLAGLLPIIPGLTTEGYQRLFIYLVGFLVYFQFPKDHVPRLLIGAQVVSAMAIATWVLISSIQGGFGPRGSIQVDQNGVTELLGFGLIALIAQVMGRRLRPVGAILTWLGIGLGVYAMLLLASRGMSIAIATVTLMLFGRILLDVRRSIPVLVVAVLVGVGLIGLPGSGNLYERFQSSDVGSANDRVPLWEATIASFTASDVPSILVGHGFESSKTLIRSVRAVLTSTHHAYLEILYEFGLFGLLAFLSIHLVLLVRFWRARTADALYGAGVVTFLLMADLSVTAPDGFLYWVAIGHLTAMTVALDRAEAHAGRLPREA